MKKIILLFLVLITIPTALANIDCQGCYNLYTEFTDTPVSQETFTQTIQDQTMSNTVTKLTGKDLTVNIYVDTTKIGAHLQDGKITTLQDGLLENPKLEVRTSRLALKHIMQAEDQKQALAQMLKEGQITYKAHTWRMKLKLWAAKKFAAKKYNITGLSILEKYVQLK